MNIYKIIYSKEWIASVRQSLEPMNFNGDRYIFEYEGCLKHALVKARSETEAYALGEEIMILYLNKLERDAQQ
jgi:hypothetical protein